MNFWGYAFLVGLLVGGYFWFGAVTLAAVFAVGSWPFLGVLALVLGLIWFAEAHEEGGLAVIPFIAFCLFVHFVSKFNLLDWSGENLTYLAWRSGQYIAAGFAYVAFRWVRHLLKKRKEIDRLAEAFRLRVPFDGPLDQAEEGTRFQFAQYVKESRYNPDLKGEYRHGYDPTEEGLVPTFRNNLLTLGRWFWWWPFSLLGYFLNNFIREVWEVIKQGLEGMVNRLSTWAFGNRANYVLTNAQVASIRRRQEDEARRQAATAATADALGAPARLGERPGPRIK